MMEIKLTLKEFIRIFRKFLNDHFDLKDDYDGDSEVLQSIRKGAELRGANLWILVFAILIASIGLNLNSTAVVIGAMLISPLMGPIIAIGVGAAVYDFELMKDALKNLLFAVAASLLASAAYFAISPLSGAQTELVARTTPTIWDVFIAFFGGLAGMIAATRKIKTNVIPGVAIATALMPPLCTAGYGLANLQGKFFLGAFYLFIINSIYICIGAFVVTKWLKIKPVERADPSLSRQIRRSVIGVGILALLPSVFVAYRLVNEEFTENRVRQYLEREMLGSNFQVLQKNLTRNKDKYQLDIVLLGEGELSQIEANLRSKLAVYGLPNVELKIRNALTPAKTQDLVAFKAGLLQELYNRNEETIKDKDERIRILEAELAKHSLQSLPLADLQKEIQAFLPMVTRFGAAFVKLPVLNPEATVETELLGHVESERRLRPAEMENLKRWVGARTKAKIVHLNFMVVPSNQKKDKKKIRG